MEAQTVPHGAAMTPELQKRLKMQGISKGARHPMFQGRRKDVSAGNFTHHVCYLCGEWRPCEMERCTHAVVVRVLPCCDPKPGTTGQKVTW